MASLVPLLHVAQLTFSSLSNTPSGPLASYGLLRDKNLLIISFCLQMAILIAVYCMHIHTQNLKEDFLLFLFLKQLGREPFICMGNSKENMVKHVAEYHVPGLRVPWAALSCLLIELL